MTDEQQLPNCGGRNGGGGGNEGWLLTGTDFKGASKRSTEQSVALRLYPLLPCGGSICSHLRPVASPSNAWIFWRIYCKDSSSLSCFRGMSAGRRPRSRCYKKMGLESYAASIKNENLKMLKLPPSFFFGCSRFH